MHVEKVTPSLIKTTLKCRLMMYSVFFRYTYMHIYLLYNFSDKSDTQHKHSEHSSTFKKHDDCGLKVDGEKQLEIMQRAIRKETLRWCIPMSVHSLFLYAHTYVTSVNITWSVSNLVPQFMDSIHSIERPIM